MKTGASVEQDIVEQMESLFKFQRTFFDEIAAAEILGISSSSLFAVQDIGFIREDEIEAVSK